MMMMMRGDAADEQRVAPSVEHPHGEIAAVEVGPEEVVAGERRPDRHALHRDDVHLLATLVDRAGDVVGVGADVGDVAWRTPAPADTPRRSARIERRTPAPSYCGAVAAGPGDRALSQPAGRRWHRLQERRAALRLRPPRRRLLDPPRRPSLATPCPLAHGGESVWRHRAFMVSLPPRGSSGCRKELPPFCSR